MKMKKTGWIQCTDGHSSLSDVRQLWSIITDALEVFREDSALICEAEAEGLLYGDIDENTVVEDRNDGRH